MSISSPSAAERAYLAVKSQIIDGTHTGGELLSEGEVAGQLGLSRTPVREAFLRLETEGWMKLYPKRGALIVPVGADDARHVAQARYVVETGAVSALSTAATDAVLPLLRASLAHQRELAGTGAVDEFAIADTDFHRTLVAAADNPLLLDFYDTLRERQQRMNASSLRRAAAVDEIVAHHEALVDCIAARNAAGFAAALGRHLAQVHGLDLPGVASTGARTKSVSR